MEPLKSVYLLKTSNSGDEETIDHYVIAPAGIALSEVVSRLQHEVRQDDEGTECDTTVVFAQDLGHVSMEIKEQFELV